MNNRLINKIQNLENDGFTFIFAQYGNDDKNKVLSEIEEKLNQLGYIIKQSYFDFNFGGRYLVMVNR